jgi:rhamnosyltransferase
MPDRSISAVMVSYNPSSDVLRNIEALRSQVDSIVIVDNGSHEQNLASLRGARSRFDFELIENGVNLGIAVALNRGVHEVKAKGCLWVALFDQDSTVGPGFIELMRKAYENCAHPSKVAIVCPVYLDRHTGIVLPLPRSRRGEILATPTSGSLIPVKVFEKLGTFNESLFIDYVDVEFSLRSRRAGYWIVESPHAVLRHSMGRTTRHRLFGRCFTSTNHSAARRYYITRNRLWLLARFIRDWSWSSKETRRAILETIKIVLVERDRLAKMKSIMLGFADALGGRLGKRFEL